MNDLDENLTIAYVMNRMHAGAGDDRAARIVAAAHAGLARWKAGER